jgi:DNA-binding CsgD family transcriptional regulator
MAGVQSELSRAVAEIGGDLDLALDEVRVAAVLVDRDGTIRWQNLRMTELAGDLVGRPLTAAVAPESVNAVQRERTKKLLGTTRTADYRAVGLDAQRRRVPVEISSVAVEGSDHEVVGVFGLVTPADVEDTPRRVAPSNLTLREAEVLHYLAEGCSTAQIAKELGIAIDTVRNHVRSLLRKLGVHSRLEAVAEARRRGLVP